MGQLTWHVAITSFLVHLSAGGRSPRTRSLRRWQLSCLAEAIPVGPLAAQTEHVEAWLAREDWTNNTRRSARTAARLFFTWLHTTGRRPDNPAAWLAPIAVAVGAPRPCPEPVLRQALLAATPEVRLMIALGAGAGCRRAEIAVARREDLEHMVGGPALRVHGKGSRERSVPILDGLAATIEARPPGWLFPSRYGGHIEPNTVGYKLSAALPGAWTAHTLRHRFASAAYAVDQDLRAVQELLGHASVATTQVYTALPDAAKRRAVAGASIGLVA